MKKTNKKLLGILAIIALVLGVIFAIDKLTPGKEVQVGSKTITIIVEDRQDETKELLNKEYKTDAQYLGELIDEAQDDLNPDLSAPDPTWGRTINGLMGLVTPDMSTGPWWMYTVNNDWADAIDQCVIADGDVILFYFSSSY